MSLSMRSKQPLQKGSVIETLRQTPREVCNFIELMAISALLKRTSCEKLTKFGTVNSDECRKPKQARLQAARNMQ